jgi:hypothetical protein
MACGAFKARPRDRRVCDWTAGNISNEDPDEKIFEEGQKEVPSETGLERCPQSIMASILPVAGPYY